MRWRDGIIKDEMTRFIYNDFDESRSHQLRDLEDHSWPEQFFLMAKFSNNTRSCKLKLPKERAAMMPELLLRRDCFDCL